MSNAFINHDQDQGDTSVVVLIVLSCGVEFLVPFAPI